MKIIGGVLIAQFIFNAFYIYSTDYGHTYEGQELEGKHFKIFLWSAFLSIIGMVLVLI